MLTIRLQRAGKRNTPQYRLVLAQKTAANQKQFVEVLGFYNPHNKELGVRDQERLNYWMNDQHVELSETVHNLLVTKQLLQAEKKKAFTVPKKEVAASEADAAPTEETPAPEPVDNGEAPEVPTEVPAPETATPETPEVTSSAPAEPTAEVAAEETKA